MWGSWSPSRTAASCDSSMSESADESDWSRSLATTGSADMAEDRTAVLPGDQEAKEGNPATCVVRSAGREVRGSLLHGDVGLGPSGPTERVLRDNPAQSNEPDHVRKHLQRVHEIA